MSSVAAYQIWALGKTIPERSSAKVLFWYKVKFGLTVFGSHQRVAGIHCREQRIEWFSPIQETEMVVSVISGQCWMILLWNFVSATRQVDREYSHYWKRWLFLLPQAIPSSSCNPFFFPRQFVTAFLLHLVDHWVAQARMESLQTQKCKKEKKNIQQQGFANGHPLNYWSADLRLIDGRADGMPSSPQSMVVCGRVLVVQSIILGSESR